LWIGVLLGALRGLWGVVRGELAGLGGLVAGELLLFVAWDVLRGELVGQAGAGSEEKSAVGLYELAFDRLPPWKMGRRLKQTLIQALF